MMRDELLLNLELDRVFDKFITGNRQGSPHTQRKDPPPRSRSDTQRCTDRGSQAHSRLSSHHGRNEQRDKNREESRTAWMPSTTLQVAFLLADIP